MKIIVYFFQMRHAGALSSIYWSFKNHKESVISSRSCNVLKQFALRAQSDQLEEETEEQKKNNSQKKKEQEVDIFYCA